MARISMVGWALLAASAGAAMAQDKKAGEPAALAGCEVQIKAGKEKGKLDHFFPMPLAQVRAAAVEALHALEFEVKKEKTPTEDRIEANKARHVGLFVGSGGEEVILLFKETEDSGQKGTLVTGETKKGFVGRAGQKSWSEAVMAQTTCALQKGATE
jgi:nucleotide-binding universal stress UspA family protein